MFNLRRHIALQVIFIAAVVLTSSCSEPKHEFSGPPLPEEVDFNFHIRPILSNNCFLCHGPDSSTREADLRLDTREGATASRDNGKAIVSGSPGRSLLIKRLKSDDPEIRMPPADQNKILSDREIALLEKWIDDGAEYKKSWWLLTSDKVAVPPAHGTWQSTNAVDHFIHKELEARGLKPAQTAAKNEELRRLSLVLTGLPPRPNELQNYIEDNSPQAYEKQVDRLLASPHFGEKWARHWMDLARYAETRGHEFDYPVIGAWMYRDYLIKAYNDDLPYDQFVIEQLAGDLISPRIDSETGDNLAKIATLFSVLNEETHSPVNIRKHQLDRIDNQIDVTSKSFLALTVACAKCHDHKFDPIPTADYYSMVGMFESSRHEKGILVDRSDETSIKQETLLRQGMKQKFHAYKTLDRPANSKPRQKKKLENAVDGNLTWIEDFRDGDWGDWTSTGIAFADTPAKGEPLFDIDTGRLEGFLPRAASGRFLSPGLPGTLTSPSFVIEEDSLAFSVAGRSSTLRIIIENFHLIQFPIYGQLETKPDSDEFETYRIDVSKWKGLNAYVELSNGTYQRHAPNLDPSSYIDLEWIASFSGSFEDIESKIDRRRQISSDPVENWLDDQPGNQDLVELNSLVKSGAVTFDFSVPPSNIPALLNKYADPKLIYSLAPGDRSIETPIFTRGNFQTPEEEGQKHRFLSAFDHAPSEFSNTASGRLEFAEAIASKDNPMTARVYVNRLWQHVFGTGIVATPDNFGAQGKLPSHPELLDYLASYLVENDWSSKAVLKELVLSSTFRQKSWADQESLEIDPDNVYLHHFPTKRMEAETIRDAILLASGQLKDDMYGPSAKVHLTSFMNGRGRPAESGPIDGEGRRSIYQEIRRNFLSPFMLAFDMPIPFSTTGSRVTSNVPAQSLTFLNDPFIHEMANRWGNELASNPESKENKVRSIYIRALSRNPEQAEIDEALSFLEKGGGSNSADAWASFVHVIFNAKEFIYAM